MSDISTLSDKERRFGAPRQKVPPFARYRGTSAWQKNRRRAREYARFRAAEKEKRISQASATPNP